ncbi:TPA: GcrA cell cycle regulator domain protein, partial [Streptococcus suis]|nr:GcrA cell cycle regulator domain protein [Streptococcus suis]
MGLVRLYTEEEIDYLWLAIEDKESNYEDVAALLGRTVCGVKGKVWKLTNGTNKGGLVRRPWTPDEIDKLRQLYP